MILGNYFRLKVILGASKNYARIGPRSNPSVLLADLIIIGIGFYLVALTVMLQH